MMGETLRETDIERPAYRVIGAGRCGMSKGGGIRGGKKIPQLMTLVAQSGSAPLIIAPCGDSALASAEGINDWLSGKLNHPVTLWPLPCRATGALPPRRARYRRF